MCHFDLSLFFCLLHFTLHTCILILLLFIYHRYTQKIDTHTNKIYTGNKKYQQFSKMKYIRDFLEWELLFLSFWRISDQIQLRLRILRRIKKRFIDVNRIPFRAAINFLNWGNVKQTRTFVHSAQSMCVYFLYVSVYKYLFYLFSIMVVRHPKSCGFCKYKTQLELNQIDSN